jgi:hypothetical protein
VDTPTPATAQDHRRRSTVCLGFQANRYQDLVSQDHKQVRKAESAVEQSAADWPRGTPAGGHPACRVPDNQTASWRTRYKQRYQGAIPGNGSATTDTGPAFAQVSSSRLSDCKSVASRVTVLETIHRLATDGCEAAGHWPCFRHDNCRARSQHRTPCPPDGDERLHTRSRRPSRRRRRAHPPGLRRPHHHPRAGLGHCHTGSASRRVDAGLSHATQA